MKGLIATALGATLMIGVSSAGAVPLANLDGASSPHVTLIYGGCGPYGHRGPWGGCRAGGQWGGGWRGPYWRGPGWRFYGGCWRGPYGGLHCN
jgi:hypothetical protein